MIKIANQHLPKIQIARNPQVGFGVSAQSPPSFHMQYSMVSNQSYLNPFVKIDKHSLSQILTSNSQIKAKQQPQWTTRVHLSNFSNIQNKNGFLTTRKQQTLIAPGLNHSMTFDQPFQAMHSQDNEKSFYKKKGEFTNYLQNHLNNIDFNGPILGDERSIQKRSNTKQKIILKKLEQLQKTKLKYSLVKPKRSLSPLLQKTKIHKNRLQLNESTHDKYSSKENIKEKTRDFELPRIKRSELQDSLIELKSNYRTFKNENLTKSFFVSSLSSVKTADFDKKGVMNKSNLR